MAQDLEKYFQCNPFFVGAAEMSDLEWGKLQDKIDRIPMPLYDLMIDSKTSDFIEELTQKYIQLSVQGPDIARIIRDVVIVDVYIGDMPAQISSKLGIDQNLALEIARAIVSQLFAPVIEDIKKVQLQKFGKLPGSSVPQPFPQHTVGEELPETGGNIIDLRTQK